MIKLDEAAILERFLAIKTPGSECIMLYETLLELIRTFPPEFWGEGVEENSWHILMFL